MAFYKVNRQGVYERLWFIGLVCVEIISAGEVSSMNQCLSVFAAAAGPPITGCLCVVGETMLTLDEPDLTLTVKTNVNTMVRCYYLWITDTMQYSFCVYKDYYGDPCYDNSV